MEHLKITIIQTALFWHQRQENLLHFENLINTIENTNLIVLPEMFTSGFTMHTHEVADHTNGETLDWMKMMAEKKNATITGSVVINDDNNFYNRLLWVNADGSYGHYDKRHLFRMARENEFYKEGTTRFIATLGNWKICPLICYDLRFPAWSRNIKWTKHFERKHQYDVLIYVANWPERRNHAWKSLLVARAIENQCYVVGVNRIGMDGNQIPYSGDSVIINPLGEIISSLSPYKEGVETISLDLKSLHEYRTSFPAQNDADEFEIF